MFRFTVRDVLWLMVVVGLAIGWRLEIATLKAVVRENGYRIDEINESGIWIDDQQPQPSASN